MAMEVGTDADADTYFTWVLQIHDSSTDPNPVLIPLIEEENSDLKHADS
jgi:hypothetical protein